MEEIRKLRTSSAKYMCSSPYFREIPNLRTFQLMVEFHKGAGLTSFFGKAPLSLDSNTRIKAALHVYGGALEVVFFVTRSWYLPLSKKFKNGSSDFEVLKNGSTLLSQGSLNGTHFGGDQTMQICGIFEGCPFNNVDGRDPAPPGMYKTRCK